MSHINKSSFIFEKKFLKYKIKNIKLQKNYKIIFNPDEEQKGGVLTSDERIIYLELCNKITSRNSSIDYSSVTTEMLRILNKEVLKEILDLDYPEEKKEKMRNDIEYIFRTIDHTDTNYIGKINIVSIQCIMVFTENCKNPSQVFEVNSNNVYKEYIILRNGDWKDYKIMRSNLMSDSLNTFYKLFYKSKDEFAMLLRRIASAKAGGVAAAEDKEPYTTNEDPNEMIFLITVMKFFTLDEIIISFLDNVIFCGISSNYTYADGRYLTPFEFIEHDITHGNNYKDICFERIGQSRINIKSFYNYCMKKSLEHADMYAIKFIVFLLIHETWCDFFPYTEESVETINEEKILNSLLTTNLCNINRFVNINDLGLSIPKIYRESKETIIEYLKIASNIYIRELKNWSKQ